MSFAIMPVQRKIHIPVAVGARLAIRHALEDHVFRQRHRAEVCHEQLRPQPRAQRVQTCSPQVRCLAPGSHRDEGHTAQQCLGLLVGRNSHTRNICASDTLGWSPKKEVAILQLAESSH